MYKENTSPKLRLDPVISEDQSNHRCTNIIYNLEEEKNKSELPK